MARRKTEPRRCPPRHGEEDRGTGGVPPSEQQQQQQQQAGEEETAPNTASASREEPRSDPPRDENTDQGTGDVRTPSQQPEKRRSQRIAAQRSKKKTEEEPSDYGANKPGKSVSTSATRKPKPATPTQGSQLSKPSQSPRSLKIGVKRAPTFTSPPSTETSDLSREEKADEGTSGVRPSPQQQKKRRRRRIDVPWFPKKKAKKGSLKTKSKPSQTTIPPSSVAPEPSVATELPQPITLEMLKTALSKLEKDEGKKKLRSTSEQFENKEPEKPESAEVGDPEEIKKLTLRVTKRSAIPTTSQIESDTDTGTKRQKMSSTLPDEHVIDNSRASTSTMPSAGGHAQTPSRFTLHGFYVLEPVAKNHFIAKLEETDDERDMYKFKFLEYSKRHSHFYFPKKDDIRWYSSSKIKERIIAKESSSKEEWFRFDRDDLCRFENLMI